MFQENKGLYMQSQQNITPIVDFIPIESGMSEPQSLKLKTKYMLDYSDGKNVKKGNFKTEIQNLRLGTLSSYQPSQQKTTSIMQGYSRNNLQEGLQNLKYTSKQHKSNQLYPQTLRSEVSPFLPSNLQAKRNQMLETRLPYSRTNSRNHYSLQRSQLLRQMTESIQKEERSNSKQKSGLQRIRRHKGNLINQISTKLAVNKSVSKIYSILVRPNSPDTALERMPHQSQWKKHFQNIKKDLKFSNEGSIKQNHELATKNTQQSSVKKINQVSAKKSQELSSRKSQQMSVKFSNLKPTLHIDQISRIRQVNSQWRQSNDRQIMPKVSVAINSSPANSQSKQQAFDNVPLQISKYVNTNTLDSNQVFTFNSFQKDFTPPVVNGHYKKVSIELESGGDGQSSSEDIRSGSIPTGTFPIADCKLCCILGKKCSFH